MGENEIIYSDYNQLPLAMSAEHVAAVLGISRANAYNLMHREDFPTLHIGKRMIVPRDKFIQWIDCQYSNIPTGSGLQN